MISVIIWQTIDAEIGKGHVDNDKGELDLDDFGKKGRKDWQLYKKELLDILDGLKEEIQHKIKNSIDDEIRASIALADYKNTILHEIELFERQLVKERARLEELEAKLIVDTKNANACHSELITLKEQKKAIEVEYTEKEAEFAHKKATIEDEISIFQEVIEAYKADIWSNDDEFKERQDDYIDDGNFDNGEYTDREVPKIKAISEEGKGQSTAV